METINLEITQSENGVFKCTFEEKEYFGTTLSELLSELTIGLAQKEIKSESVGLVEILKNQLFDVVGERTFTVHQLQNKYGVKEDSNSIKAKLYLLMENNLLEADRPINSAGCRFNIVVDKSKTISLLENKIASLKETLKELTDKRQLLDN